MNPTEIAVFITVAVVLVGLSLTQLKKLTKKPVPADVAKQNAIPEAEREVMKAEQALIHAKNNLQWKREALAYLKGKKVAA